MYWQQSSTYLATQKLPQRTWKVPQKKNSYFNYWWKQQCRCRHCSSKKGVWRGQHLVKSMCTQRIAFGYPTLLAWSLAQVIKIWRGRDKLLMRTCERALLAGDGKGRIWEALEPVELAASICTTALKDRFPNNTGCLAIAGEEETERWWGHLMWRATWKITSCSWWLYVVAKQN